MPRRRYRRGSPPLALNFDTGLALDPRITFTRASSGGRTNEVGDYVVMANNVPRFDYDVSGNALGLLIEEQRANEARSPNMSGAVVGVLGSGGALPTGWNFNNSGSVFTCEIEATGTEDGYPFVDLFISGTNNTGVSRFPGVQPMLSTDIAAAQNEVWTWSTYAKLTGAAPSHTMISVLVERDAAAGFLTQNTTNLLLSSVRQQTIVTYTLPSATAGRVSSVYQATVPDTEVFSSHFRVYGPQLEEAVFASSLILGTGGPTTRAADVATITGADFSDWFNASEGTVIADYQRNGSAAIGNGRVFSISAGSNDNDIRINFNNTPSTKFVVTDATVQQANLGGALFIGVPQKLAVAYADNDFAAAFNGGTIQTDALGTVPTVDRMAIGLTAGLGGNSLNGYIRRLTYYPTRLSNAQLQALTS